MATTTARLGLRKPETTDPVDVEADLNDNYDLVDAAIGYVVCTSATRPASPWTGMPIYETDTNHRLVYTGSAWRHQGIPVVASTASILAPYEGQVIYVTADDMLYKRRSSAWVAFAATGTTAHEARYYQAVAQSIPNATDTALTMDTAVTTTADVTPSAGNSIFTLNRAGLWVASAGARLGTGTGSERHLVLVHDSVRIAGSTTQTGLTASLTVSTTFRASAGTAVGAYYYQNSGAAINTGLSGQSTHISLTWLRP